jgi:hypothetical protein
VSNVIEGTEEQSAIQWGSPVEKENEGKEKVK